MKKIVLTIALSVLALGAAGCRGVGPDAGYEAVLVQKPWIFGHGGVADEPVSTGLSFVAFTTSPVYVNMQPLQYQVHFDDLMSADGVPLDFDAVIRLQITDSVKLIKHFGPRWYENNVEKEFANRVRQAVRRHGMNETAINTSAIEAIDLEVSEAMTAYVESAQIPVKLIQITVGKANPPDSIKSQRIETAAQQQRQLTEQQRKLAEDQRKDAEASRAKADNAYRESVGLNSEQFLRLEQIKMMEEVCGKGGCTFLVGASSVTPVMNVK